VAAAAAVRRRIDLMFVEAVANHGDRKVLVVPEPGQLEVLFGEVVVEHFRLPIEIMHKRSTARCIVRRSDQFYLSWLGKAD
jgi:hypothetical protein